MVYLEASCSSSNGRVFCIPLLVVWYILNLDTILVCHEHLVTADEVPIFSMICARLAGDNQMLAMLGSRLATSIILYVRAIRMILVLAVQCGAGFSAVIKRGRLLGCMIPKAICNELGAVGDAKVQAIGRPSGSKELLLQVEHCGNRIMQSSGHLLDGIFSFPARLVSAMFFGKVSHVESEDMLRISTSKDRSMYVVIHSSTDRPSDGREVANHSIVHASMAPEDEWMVVHMYYWRATSGSDMAKDDS